MQFILILVVIGWLISNFTGVSTDNEKSPSAQSKPAVEQEVVSVDKKRKFMDWAIKSGGVTWISFPKDGIEGSIWVTLSDEKYVYGDLEEIASFLARAYKLQTKYKGLVIVTVWNKNRSDYVAKGRA